MKGNRSCISRTPIKYPSLRRLLYLITNPIPPSSPSTHTLTTHPPTSHPTTSPPGTTYGADVERLQIEGSNLEVFEDHVDELEESEEAEEASEEQTEAGQQVDPGRGTMRD